MEGRLHLKDFHVRFPSGEVYRFGREGENFHITLAEQEIISSPHTGIHLVEGMVVFVAGGSWVLRFTESFYRVASSARRVYVDIVAMRSHLADLNKNRKGRVYAEPVRKMSEDIRSFVIRVDIMGIDSFGHCWAKFIYVLRTSTNQFFLMYENREQRVAVNTIALASITFRDSDFIFAIIDDFVCYHSLSWDSEEVIFHSIGVEGSDLIAGPETLSIIGTDRTLYEIIVDGQSRSSFTTNYIKGFPRLNVMLGGIQASVFHLSTTFGIKQMNWWMNVRLYLVERNQLVIYNQLDDGKHAIILTPPVTVTHFRSNHEFCVIFGQEKAYLLRKDLTFFPLFSN